MDPIFLNIELRQALKISPQMIQSTEILQMNSQELLRYLSQVSEENPLLEQEDNHDLRRAYEELRQKASWIDGGIYGPAFSCEEDALLEQGVSDSVTSSLSAFLCDQLDRRNLPKSMLALTKYVVELLDEDGYLLPEDLSGLEDLRIPATMIDQAVDIVQSLDPAGVGARDLSECLLLQLKRQRHHSSAAAEIVARFLSELGRKHYGPICRELNLTIAAVQAAEKVISALTPYPGREFQTAAPAEYVRPDIFIVDLDGHLQAVLNEYYLPKVSISDYYIRLLKTSEEKETRDYLQQKLQQARWLLNYLEQRGRTLRRCANAILEEQRPFFAGTTTELVPMSLSSLAESLELHPSTISRATHGKYLQCRQGTYPLRYFFNRAVQEQGPSRQAIKQRLLTLIKTEDHLHPYSDQQLCTLLAQSGVLLSRRVVTKYRIELGIGSSVARKHTKS